MEPKTLSASSLDVWGKCQARWVAEYYLRGQQPGGIPAMTGTAFHGGAEYMVKAVHIDKVHGWEWDFMLAYYKKAYVETFESYDFSTPWYEDGLQMTKKWFERTNLFEVDVLSTEEKLRFPLKFMLNGVMHEVLFTYIFDRADRLDAETIKVVDYKTYRVPVKTDALRRKIQARAYAIAARIQYPWAKKVIVEFDLIRHDPIAVIFTEAESREDYKVLAREAQRIFSTNPEDATETLNSDCGYCIRKMECETLASHQAAGGMLNADIFDVVRKKHDIDVQMKALKILAEDLDNIVMKYADETGQIEFRIVDELDDSNFYEVKIKNTGRRAADTESIKKLLPEHMFFEFGNLTMAAIDKMLKSDELDDDTKKKIKSLISKNYSPSATITPPAPF